MSRAIFLILIGIRNGWKNTPRWHFIRRYKRRMAYLDEYCNVVMGVADVYNVSAREAKEAVDKALEEAERYIRINDSPICALTTSTMCEGLKPCPFYGAKVVDE